MIYNKKGHLILLIVLAIFMMGVANQDSPISKEQKKKLEQADQLNQNAQKLLTQVDVLYKELEFQNSLSTRDDKKIKKIGEKIFSIQLKAMELYEIVYLLESSVYAELIPKLKAEYTDSKDSTLIIELIGVKAYEQFFKENKQIRDTSSFKESEAYQRYLDLAEIVKKDSLSTENNANLISYYVGGKGLEYKSQINYNQNEEDSPNSKSKKQLKFESKKTDSGEGTLKAEKNSINNDADESDSQTTDLNREIETNTDSAKTKNDLVFKVQIAADRVKLSLNKLNSIYKGQKEILMFEKDDWFKYCVGNFDTFNEANACREKCGVPDAFVIAFQGGVWIDVLRAKKIEREKLTNTK